MGPIAPGSHVTLHYRLAVVIDGQEHEVVSTFQTRPATVQVGAGHLAAPLEALLLGMCEGEEADHALAPGEAFGQRSTQRVLAMSRDAFDRNVEAGAGCTPGDVVQVRGPQGAPVAGVLKSLDPDRAVVDLNHPLAGRPVRFSVRILGVL